MKNNKTLASAVVLLASVWISRCVAATCSTLENNVDYSGADVGSARSASVNGCCSICSNTNGCGAFTWTNYNGGTCWLKKSKGTTEINNGAVPGALVVPAATCSSLENNVDYSGADVGSARSASANGCCSICSKTNGCGAFTWTNYNGGTCWLKKSSGAVKVTRGAVSGVLQRSNSDPALAKFSLSAFATGAWGATTYKGSCCGSNYNNYDLNAQEVVATLMNIEAGASLKPKAILGHGDSLYWTGINSLASRDGRYAASFEAKYDGDNIKYVPWVNVMGNHDYGGSDFICTSGEKLVPCNTTEELFQGLENKLKWQAGYTSPNDNRWHMDSRFYVHRIQDPATGVSIDIFNVDTNDAEVHGAELICCQCYGYVKDDSSGCNTITREGKYCFGGNTALFDTCMATFAQWGDESHARLAAEVKQSTATWKIVNSHFSPNDHYYETGMKKWFDVLRNSGVRVFLHGHTHAEKHDHSDNLGVHFVENGAGGGRQKGPAGVIQAYAAKYVKKVWEYSADEYGFFSLQASKDWRKLQYHTADTKWVFTENWADTTIGGVATKHRWYIPADGSEGKAC